MISNIDFNESLIVFFFFLVNPSEEAGFDLIVISMGRIPLARADLALTTMKFS
jgi:hypothetical protein